MSAKWRNIIREKLMPIYEGIHRYGQIANVTIPAANDGNFDFFKWELTLYFTYKDDSVIFDDIYGTSHVFCGDSEYISCYYIVEPLGDGDYEEVYVEVGRSITDVLSFLFRTFSPERLLKMQVGDIDDVLSYTHG